MRSFAKTRPLVRCRGALVAASLVTATTSGCGGGASPRPADPPPTARPAVVTGPVVQPKPPSQPVGVPDGVAIVARASDVPGFLKAVANWGGRRIPLLNAFPPERLVAMAVGDTVADVVDLRQSVDGALVLAKPSSRRGKPGRKAGDDPEGVVSFAVRSFEEARDNLAEDYKLDGTPDGGFALVAKEKSRGAASPLPHCELRPSAPAGAHRIVCATSRRALQLAGRYLAETVAPAKVDADLYAEARLTSSEVNSVLDALGEDDAAGTTEASIARKAGREWTLSFLADAAAASLDFSLDPREASLGLTVHFRSAKGDLARYTLAIAEAAERAPEAFFHLPEESTWGLYYRDPKTPEVDAGFESLKRKVIEIVQENETGRRAAFGAEVVEGLFALRDDAVLAGGGDYEAATRALDKPAPKTPAARRAESEATSGWVALGSGREAALWIDWNRRLGSVRDLPEKPDEKDVEEGSTSRLTERPIRPADKLPRGSVHFVWTTTPTAAAQKAAAKRIAEERKKPPEGGERAIKPAPIATTSHVFVMPATDAGDARDARDAGGDGDRERSGGKIRTWVVTSGSETRARAIAQRLVRSRDGRTLATRAELSGLASVKTNAGGFVTAAAVTGVDVFDKPRASVAEREDAKQRLAQLAALPHRGATPIVFFLEGRTAPALVAPDASRAAALRVVMPSGAMEDVVSRITAP